VEGSNRVEPLMRHKNELKRRPLSVLAGAQIYQKLWLRYDARIG